MSARKVTVDGLGKLPAFCHASVAGDFIYVSGTLGTKQGSFELVDAFARRSREIDDAHLRSIAGRYGAPHAVLYRETASGFPTLAEDDSYRIVSLEP